MERESIFNRIRHSSIATKHFLFLFFVTLGLFLLLAWMNLGKAEHVLRSQKTGDAELLAARTNQFIDASLDNIENIVLLLENRLDLLKPENEQLAIDTLRQYASKSSSIARTLYMIRSDGSVISSSQVYYDILGNPELPRLYELALDNYGALNVSEPYVSPLSGRTLAYVLPMSGEGKNGAGQYPGVVVAEVNLDFLTTSISPMIYQSFAILTRDGNMINRLESGDKLLPTQAGVYPPILTDDFRSSLMELQTGTSEIKGRSEKLMAVKTSTNRLGWSLIAFIEEDYLYQSLHQLNTSFRVATLVWTIVLLISAFMLSRLLTRPIRRLVHKMDMVENVEVIPRLFEDRKDEIGRLSRSYRAMLERIQQLLQKTRLAEERKKEFELKMLRSQISPHFLYNTLACVSSLARQQRIDEVRETIRALIRLLSFSFDKHSEYVTLQEELDGLSMYMHIQQIRYGGSYRYRVEVDPALLDQKMLKLSLQPLVENALFHGIAPKEGGTICVRGSMDKGIVRLYVRDDGVGMAPYKAKIVRSNSEQEDDSNPEPENGEETKNASSSGRYSFTGIGLQNVHDRIRIHYGDRYGLRIRSLQGTGTIVRLTFPRN
ncbi:sensor histidine kinase [Paenibacillus sp. HB172176]|uniref:cache domain-containing sensor histidine kinase n=1 Tax=Paenibacillus sp. HB172176 TaxID=2493690 RepID=UPI0014395C74|nr:sensor histidine kinase [Paenibacillus sp. HB172176]